MTRKSENCSNYYVAYGATLECDLDLSRYLMVGKTTRCNVRIAEKSPGIPCHYPEHTGIRSSSHGRQLALYSDTGPATPGSGQNWCFEVKDIARIFWVSKTEVIEYERGELCTEKLLAFWLIHIFLPIYFTLQGFYEFIHASAVEVAGDTVLFTGPSHGGKSTMTDYFLRQGHTLVSDDKVATFVKSGQYFALPSHPNHRPYRKFEDLGNRVIDFSPDPRLLRVFYALRVANPEADVTIEEITGHEKFAQILPGYLFDFPHMQEKRLRYLAGMVSAVPVFRVGVPWDLERLDDVHDAIAGHLKSIRVNS